MDKEISRILDRSIRLETKTKIVSPEGLLNEGFDAVVVAVGTHQGSLLPMEGNTLAGVMINTDFLRAARQQNEIALGERVMVLGGGNVAYDCARTALRLGAKEVGIACLENLDQMTATRDEIEEGREEGIILYSAHSFQKILGEEKVEGILLQEVKNFYFDENRRAVIELLEGSEKEIGVDNVIFAVGQRPRDTDKMGLDLINRAYIKTDKDLKTSREGVYAAGDVVTGTKSVIAAIAEGRKVASQVDCYLGGDGDISEEILEKEAVNPFIGRTENFAGLKRVEANILGVPERCKSFSLVEETLGREAAMKEAERCLQCDLRLTITKPKLWNEY